MKKILQIFLLTSIMVLACGCSASTGQEKQNSAATAKTQTDKAETKESTPLKRPEAADYIQSAIDYANKIAGDGLVMDDEGNFFVVSKNPGSEEKMALIALYSCYGKDIKQLRRWGGEDFLILTKNGDVYHNTKLLSSGQNVIDMLWKTNNVGVSAALLLENGGYIEYYGGSKLSEERTGTAITACRWREDLMGLDANGDCECGGRWKNCEVKGWKNTVVLAITANEDTKTATIAGIAADGTVYATGDYADDILSWGALAYISMDDKLIVGLKKDGTLAFTGELGEKYSALAAVEAVKGVRLWRGHLWAITEDDILYSYYEHTSDPEITSAEFRFKLDKEGNIYENTYSYEDGSYHWALSDYPKADAENGNGLVLYQLLLNSEEIKSFSAKDLNGDGFPEIIANTKYGEHVIYENRGYLYNFGHIDGWLAGYYPNASIYVVKDTDWRRSEVTYKGYGSKICLKSEESTNDPTEKRFYEFTGSMKEISEDEFNEKLKSYIGDEEMCPVKDEDFIENTEENLRSLFLK